jgi:hypothetical protein
MAARKTSRMSAAVLVIGLGLLALCRAMADEATEAKFAAWKAEISKQEQAVGKRFVPPPKGKFYEATAPDTLDLADRAGLAINCLTGALDPDYGYELYFAVRFTAQPPFMLHDSGGLTTINPKFAESLVMMRLMSGSDQNLDIERGMMERTLALIWNDGLH